MTKLRDSLEIVHKDTCTIGGELALALASGRGVSRNRLREWAAALRTLADKMEEEANG